MKHRRTFPLLSLCLFILVPSDTPAQTGRPNSDPRDTFYFASSPYRVAEDVGEAVVRVGWIPYPGNTNGWVLFRTLDGSALAARDFHSRHRILYFSAATNVVSIPVPIILDDDNENEEYLILNLAAGYSSRDAVSLALRITNVRVGPRLNLAFAEDGSVNIWWRDDGITRVLEKANAPSAGEWTSLDTPSAGVGGGILSVTNVPFSTTGFYRLRKVD